MVDDFLSYIEEEALINTTDKVLLAVSGGIDSVVMAYLFKQTSFNFGIAHCNFQLRAHESDDDELFVKALAEQLNKPFFSKCFNTKKYANENGVSTQMAARNLRYEWFEEIKKKEGFDTIATAHHINDSIETVLFNFSKGTGISGVRGILPKTTSVIRPLLFTSRPQIERFANQNELDWREDSSNKTDNYARNRIRHNIVPELTELNPRLEVTALSTLKRLRDVEAIFKHHVFQFKNERVTQHKDAVTISLHNTNLLIGFRTILYEVIKDYGFNYSQTLELLKRINEPGRIFTSKSHSLNVDRDQLVITKNNDLTADFCCEIYHEDKIANSPHGILKFDWNTVKPTPFPNNRNIAFITVDELTFPIKLRRWKPGDSFHPLGMKNKKKLSDFMIDRKIPLNLKKNIMVLESANTIIWIVGHQPDDRFKLTQNTSTICRIEFTPS